MTDEKGTPTKVVVTGTPVEPATPLTAEEKAAEKAADKLAADTAKAEAAEEKAAEDARVKRNKEIDKEVKDHLGARKDAEKAKEADLANWEADLTAKIRTVLETRDAAIEAANDTADAALAELRGDVEYQLDHPRHR